MDIDGGSAARRRHGVPHVGSGWTPFGDARVVFAPLWPGARGTAVQVLGSSPAPAVHRGEAESFGRQLIASRLVYD